MTQFWSRIKDHGSSLCRGRDNQYGDSAHLWLYPENVDAASSKSWWFISNQYNDYHESDVDNQYDDKQYDNDYQYDVYNQYDVDNQYDDAREISIFIPLLLSQIWDEWDVGQENLYL